MIPPEAQAPHQIHPGFTFRVLHIDRDSRARCGLLTTPHGAIETPIFMPVGTQATVKALDPADLRAAGAQIILSNTYHLHLRPGEDIVALHGGLHRFCGWTGPILTDSGGFQVFSLSQQRPGASMSPGGLVALGESGVTFRSHLDGSQHEITPESAMEIQARLGADIVMAFDQCSPTHASYDQARAGMETTHRWAARCRSRWLELQAQRAISEQQAMFGIVQGGAHPDLRRASAEAIRELALPGIAIGGESIGYDERLTGAVLDWVADLLPSDRPRYAMGVGDPASFFTVVERGIDMFDSVLPTRLARNGTLLTSGGRLRLMSRAFTDDDRPPDGDCDCPTCATCSRALLRALFRARSPAAYRLASVHNVRFCLRLVGMIRAAIADGRFESLRDSWAPRLREDAS